MPSIFDDPKSYAFSDDKEEDLSIAKNIWNYLTNAGETMATLGTGALAGVAGPAYGIYKGVTSPKYGTYEGGVEADKAAMDMMAQLTYQPRGEFTQGLLGKVGGAMDSLKIPALLPEVAMLGALGLNDKAILSQTQRGIRAAEPMVGNALENYMVNSGLAPRIVPEGGLLGSTPKAPVSPAGFYSAAEQAALNLPRNKGTGQALLNDLLKGADVKRDELQATGVLDAFANRPQATKQELIDFLQANRIEVGQTQFGTLSELDPVGMAKREEIFDKYYPEIQSIYKEIDATNYDTDFKTSQNLDNKLRTLTNARDMEANAAYAIPISKPTRYETWAMPGGENYREVLLTLPTKRELPSGYKVMQNPSTAPNAQKYIVVDKSGERYGSGNTESDALNKYFEYHTTDAYKSSHWDEPNVMAHLRLNDRVDADGKKMTLIEELQSDWHQAGREVGYKTGQEKSPAAIERELTVVTRKRSQLLQEAADLPDSEMARFKEMNAEIKRLGDEAMRLNDEWTNALNRPEGVPDAPMKDTWYQTALRKAVKDAIDNGSDRVGIPTGSRIADRFGKGKYVESFDVGNVDEIGAREVRFKIKDGGTVFAAIDKDGKIIEGNSNLIQPYMGKDLSKVIGKKATIKINSYGKEGGTFAMDGEMLGGQGMKQYYDETYPNYLEKFAKKYGSKVSETEIKIGQQIQLGGIGKVQTKTEKVRYIDITPEMRKALGGKDKGVPLFGAGAGALGLLATDEELKKDMQSLLGY